MSSFQRRLGQKKGADRGASAKSGLRLKESGTVVATGQDSVRKRQFSPPPAPNDSQSCFGSEDTLLTSPAIGTQAFGIWPAASQSTLSSIWRQGSEGTNQMVTTATSPSSHIHRPREENKLLGPVASAIDTKKQR